MAENGSDNKSWQSVLRQLAASQAECLLDLCGLNSEQESLRQVIHQPDLLIHQVLTFEHPDGDDIVDVFLLEPKAYAEIANDAQPVTINGHTIKIASIASLRKLKETSGRQLDERDLVMLDEYQRLQDEGAATCVTLLVLSGFA